MGGITKALFGGSSQKSTNQAYPMLSNSLGSLITGAPTAFSAIGNFLGLNGAGGNAAAKSGLNNFLSSTGGQFMLDQGSKAITGNNAARGLLNSGATGKALTKYGQNLAATQSQNYLNQLANMTGLGLQAANTVSGAGNKNKGSSQGGIIPGLFG